MKRIPDWIKCAILTTVLVWSIPALYFLTTYYLTMRIAKENFAKAKIRSDVLFADSGLRAMEIALNAYRADNFTYPPAGGEARLTTPVGYLHQLNKDRFSPEDSDQTYAYFSNGDAWVVASRGPDRDLDVDQSIFPYEENLLPLIYDATNGATSSGDVVRFNFKQPR